jgi:Lysyl oxidase
MPRVRTALAASALAAVCLVPAGSAAAAAARPPHLRLFAATSRVTIEKFGRSRVQLGVGAYLAAMGGDFRLDVARAGYRSPIRVSEVIGGERRALPATVAHGWAGIAGLVTYTVSSASRGLIASRAVNVCPNDWNRQRVDGSGPLTSRYPQFCGTNPFTLGSVWGIDRGWAVGLDGSAPAVRLPVGTYTVRVSLAPAYAGMFGVAPADATTTVTVRVVRGQPCPPSCGGGLSHRRSHVAPGFLPRVATDNSPDPSTMPDLIPLPAWGIGIDRQGGRDYLDFGATVWDAGPAPMDVEGFRRPGTNIMDAFQYFFRQGRPVGRARAGTMLYDSRPGHEHWHFQQFARYSLLSGSKTQAVRSEKEGFCLAPTDAIDLTVRGALWDPYSIGLGGQCGDATSIWTRETLPAGWGDTYFQFLPGQSFDVTGLRNGTYYVEVRANPLGSIHETSTANDVRLRKVILGGTPGARTVRVPAWNGIDPE